jgi:CBS domain-containing protein
MLSHRDILPFLSKQYSESGYELSADGIDEFVLRKVMTKEVICLDQCTPLRDALEIFVSRKIGCIPILNDLEELIGIVTPIDVLRVLKNVLPAKANTKS